MITLWLCAVMPTRAPLRSSSTITAAAVKVFPVPGGPWMQSVVPSSFAGDLAGPLDQVRAGRDQRSAGMAGHPRRPALQQVIHRS